MYANYDKKERFSIMELKKILIGIDGLKAKGSLDIDVKGMESLLKLVN